MNNIIKRLYSSKKFQNIRLINYKKITATTTTEKIKASYVMVDSWYNKNNNELKSIIKEFNPESNYKDTYDKDIGLEFPSSRFN